MVVFEVPVNGCNPVTIVLGRRGTYNTQEVTFDLSYLVENYGAGTAVLMVKRSQDTSAYPAVVSQESNTLTWGVSDVDTFYPGSGECELMWYVDEGLAKTIIYPMVVMRDILQTTEEPPDGYENWIEHLTELGAETQQNAQDAAQSASKAKASEDSAAESAQRAKDAAGLLVDVSATATTLDPGQPATAEYNDGVFKFGIPKGDKLTYADLTKADKEDLVQGPIKDAQDDAVEAVGTAKTNAVDAVNQAGTTQKNAVNQAGTTQKNAVTQEGTTQVNTVREAGTTQVGRVTTEGNTQVGRVQDKGDEVIASIPSDYSDLTAEVDDLTRQLSDLNENVDPAFFVKQLEPGSVNTDGSDNDGPKEIRRRTPKAHALKGSVLCVPDQFGEFYFEVVAIDGSGGSGDWVREWYFEDDEDFRLICRKTDNTAWNTSDEEEFIKTVRFASAPLNYYKYRVGETIRSICHAGADGAPENTIPAFIEGYNAGFEIMECDSRITKDGVFVLLHDATINRTGRNADGSVIAQTLNVSDLTYKQLLEYDFGIWKGAKYAGTKIPKIEEALKLFRDLGVGVYVDLGSYPYFSKEQIWELMEIVDSCGMHDRATYIVQSGYASYILERDKTANFAVLGSNAANWILAATCLTGENAVSLNAQIDTITQDKINNALQHGIPMEAWPVTDDESQAAVDNFSYLTGITGTINPAQLYYRNRTEYDNENIPEVFNGRATITSGGYMQHRGTVHVNCIIKSNYTASNSPNILHGFPQPKDNIAAVSIIEFTDDLSTISSFGGAITNATGTLIMPHITSEKNYLISGEYQIT